MRRSGIVIIDALLEPPLPGNKRIQGEFGEYALFAGEVTCIQLPVSPGCCAYPRAAQDVGNYHDNSDMHDVLLPAPLLNP